MLSETRRRSDVDPRFIAFRRDPNHDVVGKAHDQRAGHGFDPAWPLFRGLLLRDHFPVHALHGFAHEIIGFLGRAFQDHWTDIGIGGCLLQCEPVIGIGNALVTDGPLDNKRFEPWCCCWIGRNIVDSRQ